MCIHVFDSSDPDSQCVCERRGKIFLIRSDCMLLPKMHGYYNYYQEAILIVNTYYVYIIYIVIMIMLMQHQATHILAR